MNDNYEICANVALDAHLATVRFRNLNVAMMMPRQSYTSAYYGDGISEQDEYLDSYDMSIEARQ